MKLFEMTDTYREFMDAVERGDIPEEAIADTLEGLDGMFEDKAENIGCLLKELSAEITAFKEEEKALAERRRAKENHHARLKDYLAGALQRIGKDKLETPRVRLSFRASTAVEFEDEATFLRQVLEAGQMQFVSIKDPTLNRKAIGDALKSGAFLPPGARIAERYNLQVK